MFLKLPFAVSFSVIYIYIVPQCPILPVEFVYCSFLFLHLGLGSLCISYLISWFNS